MSPARTATHRTATIRWDRQTAAGPFGIVPRRTADAESAAAAARAIIPTDDPREHFAVLALDAKHRLIGSYLASIGTLDATLIHPREILRFGILASAAGLILAHNHPSGEPTPSADDLALTRRMVEAGELLGIAVLDHVIVTPDGPWYSIRTNSPQYFRR